MEQGISKIFLVSGMRAFNGYRSSPLLAQRVDQFHKYYDFVASALKGPRWLEHILEWRRLDVIILYSWNCLEIEPVIHLAHRHNIKTVCDVVEWPTVGRFHGGFLNPLYWTSARTWSATHFLCDGILAISSFIEKRYHEANIPTLRIPAIVDPRFLPGRISRKCSSTKSFHLVYLGRMDNKDDPETMWIAIQSAIKKGCTVYLDIIGTDGNQGAASEFKTRFTRDHNLSAHVTFHGRVNDDALPALLIKADAFILLRRKCHETHASFPTRLPELLLSGIPVITSNVGDIPEYLTDGVNALLIPPEDPATLAESIISLANDPDRRYELGYNGRRIALKSFSYRKYAIRLIQFLQNIGMGTVSQH